MALLAQQRGLVAETRAGPDNWSVVVQQSMPASPAAIRANEEIVREIAATCGAEYDGFERQGS